MNKVSNIINNKVFKRIAVLVILFAAIFGLSKSISNSNKELVVLNNRIDRRQFKIYKQKIDGNGYEEYNGNGFPGGYALNTSLTVCVDTNNNIVENIFTYTNGKFSVTSNKTVFCTLYFDGENYLKDVFALSNPLVQEYKGPGWVGEANSEDRYFNNNIYYWYIPSTSFNEHTAAENAAIVKDSWNVVFGGFCWQMIRTTENGGVTLLYNGEAELGEDLDGNTTYDCSSNRASYHLGGIETSTYISNSGNKIFTDSYTVTKNGSSTTFNLVNSDGSTPVGFKVTTSNIASTVGKYTCNNTSTSCSGENLLKVIRLDEDKDYYVYAYKSTIRESIGKSAYNDPDNALGYVGYMYNDITRESSTAFSNTEQVINGITSYATLPTLNSTTLSWYFSDGYLSGTSAYSSCGSNSNTEGNSTCYALDSTRTTGSSIVGSPEDYSKLIGKYTLKSSTGTTGLYSKQSTLYYVIGYSGTTLYLINLSNNHPLTYYQKTYHLSQTYSGGSLQSSTQLKNFVTPTELQTDSTSWQNTWPLLYSTYNNQNYFACVGTDTCTPWFIGTATWYDFRYFNSYEYKFSNTITYDTSTNKYTIHMSDDPDVNLRDSDAVTLFDYSFLDSTEVSKIGMAHYVCLDENNRAVPNETECTNIGYTFKGGTSGATTSIAYMPLSDGQYISTDMSSTTGMTKWADEKNLLYKILYSDNVNNTDSTVKANIDKWYENNLYNTTAEKLIDTEAIYCNARTRNVANSSTWSFSGSMNTYGYYRFDLPISNTQLSINGSNVYVQNIGCPNKTDAFSKDETAKGNGALTYPIGMVSRQELYNLGYYSGLQMPADIVTLTPYDYYSGRANIHSARTNGNYPSYVSGNAQTNIRPYITLVSRAIYTRGDGSMTNPYVVES